MQVETSDVTRPASVGIVPEGMIPASDVDAPSGEPHRHLTAAEWFVLCALVSAGLGAVLAVYWSPG